MVDGLGVTVKEGENGVFGWWGVIKESFQNHLEIADG